MNDGGFALLIVLWTVVLLSFLAFAIASAGRGQMHTTDLLRLHARLQHEADGGVWEAAFHLLDTSAGHWGADGADHPIRRGNTRLDLRITSEAGKINPNIASTQLLLALLRATGSDMHEAQALTLNIRAWRFPASSDGAGLPGGPAAYVAAGLPYGPPGTPFQSVGELRLVLGMTPVLAARIIPHLSIYWDDEPVAGQADPVVRQAMMSVGNIFPTDETARAEQVVSIESAATDRSGARAFRHAIIMKTPADNATAPVRVLEWDIPGGK
ncbi:type II secretion system protein GspK [Gluconacetobacter entanii]|uniref:Type II secretion system protein GspK n=1 Tax=Gluconacetobacter entanii TaxID=108528 RepID=A0ABT3KAC2_9PROT|nr:type II secretion system protein GspK [Gluconacetobacter entanii]MCW4592391.1 type II secretion system protein GspK [Gluconacetobacter entanii]MCW4595599.1 type II secretion system protein GspK [Gluconacetobacter entanii]NPC87604.1 general secretion pathway protein GspK [Gluconacetobacter entanii]